MCVYFFMQRLKETPFVLKKFVVIYAQDRVLAVGRCASRFCVNGLLFFFRIYLK